MEQTGTSRSCVRHPLIKARSGGWSLAKRVSYDAQGTDGILAAIEDPGIRPKGEPNV
jgi:hypothetical protein